MNVWTWPRTAVKTVRVVEVLRRGGAQVLICHEPDADEWATLVLARAADRVEPGDVGILSWVEDGARSGWDFAKGVRP